VAVWQVHALNASRRRATARDVHIIWAGQRIERWLILTALWLNYNIKTWTGLSVEESVRMTEETDKWRKYVRVVANPRIDDGYGTEQKFTARESLSCVHNATSLCEPPTSTHMQLCPQH